LPLSRSRPFRSRTRIYVGFGNAEGRLISSLGSSRKMSVIERYSGLISGRGKPGFAAPRCPCDETLLLPCTISTH